MLDAGTIVGDRYEILSQIGRGAMGEVYRARDASLQRFVAVKFLTPELAIDPQRVQRFENEARTAAGLNHPNILHVYEFGRHPLGTTSAPFIVMELVEGYTLRQHLDRGVDESQLLAWLAQVADALAAAHNAGIVHRDLKPENILISAKGYAKVADFGLAKLTEGPSQRPQNAPTAPMLTPIGRAVGTPAYMSPEQAEGEHLDHRSDVFAFGTILYEAIAGRRPFKGTSDNDTMHRIVKKQPPPIATSSPILANAVRKCLEKRPENRYQNMLDVASDIRAVLNTRDSPPLRRFSFHRLRWSKWTVGAVLVAIVLVAVAYLTRRVLIPPTSHGQQRADVITQPQRPAPQDPWCDLGASPSHVRYGEAATLTWASSAAARAVITPDIGLVTPTGTARVTPRETTTYEIVVVYPDGTQARGSVPIVVAPPPTPVQYTPVAGSFAATPDTIRRGQATTLKWTSVNATKLVITPSIGIVATQGSITASPPTTTTYTLVMTNENGGIGRGSATVHVAEGGLAPDGASSGASVTCIAATQPGLIGSPFSDETSCSVPSGSSITAAKLHYELQDGGEVQINDQEVLTIAPTAGTHINTVDLSSSLFRPGASFRVKVTARSATSGSVFGRAVAQVATVTDNVLLPAAGLAISPGTISKGESADLSWSSTNTTSLAIKPEIGPVKPFGSIRVSPRRTTTYTITGTNASGMPAKASATLVVR